MLNSVLNRQSLDLQDCASGGWQIVKDVGGRASGGILKCELGQSRGGRIGDIPLRRPKGVGLIEFVVREYCLKPVSILLQLLPCGGGKFTILCTYLSE